MPSFIAARGERARVLRRRACCVGGLNAIGRFNGRPDRLLCTGSSAMADVDASCGCGCSGTTMPRRETSIACCTCAGGAAYAKPLISRSLPRTSLTAWASEEFECICRLLLELGSKELAEDDDEDADAEQEDDDEEELDDDDELADEEEDVEVSMETRVADMERAHLNIFREALYSLIVAFGFNGIVSVYWRALLQPTPG